MNFLDYAEDISVRIQSNMELRVIEQGYICPNQFADKLATLEPGVDERGPLEDVMADAQHVAD
jgi:hypothetical protein